MLCGGVVSRRWWGWQDCSGSRSTTTPLIAKLAATSVLPSCPPSPPSLSTAWTTEHGSKVFRAKNEDDMLNCLQEVLTDLDNLQSSLMLEDPTMAISQAWQTNLGR